MYKVLYNKKISKNTYEMAVVCSHVINNSLPGQFAIVMAFEDSERIPLTIYDIDKEKGILYLIYQVVGASTYELSFVKKELFSVSGPLGNPNKICKNPVEFQNRKILYIAGGVGIAPVYPQVSYLSKLGFKIDVIYGAKSKELFIIKDKIEKVSNKVFYVSDDGSYGKKGNVVDILKTKYKNYDLIVCIGSVIMMKYVCDFAKEHNIETIVSMNPVMVDGSGMCGACRCSVNGEVKFACIHGPEFDGLKVDFDSAIKRLNTYKEEELIKLQEMKERLK